MKRQLTLCEVLRWASYLKLCGPILDTFKRFLETEGEDGKKNLDRINEKAGPETGDIISRIHLEFTLHVMEKAFQVAV